MHPPILIHASPILIHAIPILIHCLGFRLSAPYLYTLPTRPGSTLEPSAVGSQFESSITSPELSANQNRSRKNPSTSSAKQNRLLRNPSRQPIRIEHYVNRVEYYATRELSARLEDPSWLSARVGLL